MIMGKGSGIYHPSKYMNIKLLGETNIFATTPEYIHQALSWARSVSIYSGAVMAKHEADNSVWQL